MPDVPRSTLPAATTANGTVQYAGHRDVRRARAALSSRLDPALSPFAWLAYNYAWSWSPDGPHLFGEIDAYRCSMCRQNPVRLLQEASARSLARAANNAELTTRASLLRERIEAHLLRPFSASTGAGPIAFFCAEYAVHPSLPTYSGGLGVLAGGILKAASDQALPQVGGGVLYRQGIFHQNVDSSGWQREYWTEADPDRLPAVLITGDDGHPLIVPVPLRGREVLLQVWRGGGGPVPL